MSVPYFRMLDAVQPIVRLLEKRREEINRDYLTEVERNLHLVSVIQAERAVELLLTTFTID